MDVVHLYCAGLDVHKKTVVACVITPKPKGGWSKEIRTFTTMMTVAHSILVIAYHMHSASRTLPRVGSELL